MSNISVFQFKHIEVRTVEKDSLIWFVASDIAKALDYVVAKDLTRMLDGDEKGRHNVPTPSGDQDMTVINESGLYHALLKSRKPEAQPFRKWVTSEVLPAIRKTGEYQAPKPRTPYPKPYPSVTRTEAAVSLFRQLRDFEDMIGVKGNAATIGANQAVNKLTGVNLLELMEHKHLIAANQSLTYNATQLAELCGLTGPRVVNLLLEAGGYHSRHGQEWVPTELGYRHGEMYDTGKAHGNGSPVRQWRWVDSVLTFLNQSKAA